NYFFTVMIVFSLMITACSEKMSDDNGDNEKDRLENLNDAEMPIVKETITLEIFAGQSPTTNPNWNDVLIFNEYEELTNIDAKFQMVPHESLSEKRNLELYLASKKCMKWHLKMYATYRPKLLLY